MVGYQLPPQRILSKALGVNRNTDITAYEELTADGLIEGNRGSGTRVVNNTEQYLRISYSYASLPDIEDGLRRLSKIVKTIAT